MILLALFYSLPPGNHGPMDECTTQDNIPKDNKPENNKAKNNKYDNNKPLKIIDLSDDKDQDDYKNDDKDDDNISISALVVIFCAFSIFLGLVFNILTVKIFQPVSIIPSILTKSDFWNPRMLLMKFYFSTIILCLNILIEIMEIIGTIYEMIPKYEIPALVFILMLNLLIILSAMVPKMTADQFKKVGKIMGSGLHNAFFVLSTVSF